MKGIPANKPGKNGLLRFISYALLSVVIIGSALMVWLSLFDSQAHGGTKPEVICASNLNNIDICKQFWAIDKNKTTNDIPTADDIRTYFSREVLPKCPRGGTYTIGRLAEMPTCSIPEHTAAYRAGRQ